MRTRAASSRGRRQRDLEQGLLTSAPQAAGLRFPAWGRPGCEDARQHPSLIKAGSASTPPGMEIKSVSSHCKTTPWGQSPLQWRATHLGPSSCSQSPRFVE